LLLLRDPVRRPAFIPGSGKGRGLFDKIVDVLADHGNPLIKF